MQYLQEADVFATPVGELITLNKERRISSCCGIFGSIVFYAFSLLAVGFLIAGITGSDNYFG